MSYFDTKDKKRGLFGTIGVHLLILVLFAIYGLKYPDPLPEVGIPVNFGTSDVGSGEVQPDTPGDPPPTESSSEPVEATEQDVLTQDLTETIETPPTEEQPDPKPDPVKEKPKETPKETKDPVEEEKPRELDSDVKNMLDNAFKNPGQSQGDDKNKSGDKGQPDGDDGNNYKGNPGGGGGGTGNYRLGNRNALAKVKPEYKCEEYGTVVMLVKVNRSGTTIDAQLQLKGTSNTAPCLVNRAKEAALKTKWEGDPSAPAVQVGTITYHFELN